MKTIALISILTLSLVSLSSAEKKVGVSESEFNYGRIIQHVVLTHDYWIKSLGDEPVKIVQTIPGCGCTQIPLTDSIIPPGDSVNMRIILNTQNFMGRITKHPAFRTDADTTEVKLKMYAEVERDPDNSVPFKISPREADVSQFTDKVRRRGRVLITNQSSETFTINPVDTSNRSFSVRFPEKIAPGETVEVFLLVHKEAIETEFKESITFEAVGQTERVRYSIPVVRIYKPSEQ